MITIKTYYLIDYENVHSDGLHGYDQLDSTDHVNIFFTKNGTNVDMSIISNGKAEIKMTEVPAGDQSADMHICSYIGYLAGVNSVKQDQCTVIIVSKDTDYDNVINFWNSIGHIKATRTSQIRVQTPKSEKKASQPKAKAEKKTATKKTGTPSQPKKAPASSQPTQTTNADESKMNKLVEELKAVLKKANYKEEDIKVIAMLAIAYYGDKDILSRFHNELTTRFSNFEAIYKLTKPVLSKYVTPKKKAPKQDPKKELTDNILKTMHNANYSKDAATFVCDTVIANYSKKNRKQNIYQAIIYQYGSERGLKMYNHIKKLI